MRVEVEDVRSLVFDDGTPVRAASAAAPWRDGVLVVQDDATHAAHVVAGGVRRVRVLPPVRGLDVFSEAAGTKQWKPDLEAATALPGGDVLLLGSGSTDQRQRCALLRGDDVLVAALDEVYDAVRAALGVEAVNMEGACVVGDDLRWFHRGIAGAPSGSVDVELAALVSAFERVGDVPVRRARTYDLPGGLAVTDALALPDGRVLVTTAAEDSPDAYADGAVGAAGLALLDDERVVDTVPLPVVAGEVVKVEGLCRDEAGLLGVVDADDPERASLALRLRVEL